MVEITVKYYLDYDLKESQIDFFVNDVLETNYFFKEGRVTSPGRRKDLVVGLDGYKQWVSMLKDWSALIQTNFKPQRQPKSVYKLELEKTIDSIKTEIVIDGKTINTDSWNNSSKEFTLRLRDLVDLAWPDFLGWLKYMTALRDEAQYFSLPEKNEGGIGQ